MQLVNTGFNYPIIFSIDQHNLTVIANDLVAIEPFTVPSLTISPGQRYTIVVEAKQELDDDANYWIRTGTECGGWNAAVTDNRTAIIHYDGAVQKLPTVDHPMPFNATCLDVPARLLRPKVPWRVDEHPRSILNYTATKQTNASHSLGPPWYKHWTLGKQPMWLDFSKPTILDPDTSLRNVNYTATEGRSPIVLGMALFSRPNCQIACLLGSVVLEKHTPPSVQRNMRLTLNRRELWYRFYLLDH
jgi:FtsP/CotA-like multicopper oxidase with cupredoxin domain